MKKGSSRAAPLAKFLVGLELVFQPETDVALASDGISGVQEVHRRRRAGCADRAASCQIVANAAARRIEERDA